MSASIVVDPSSRRRNNSESKSPQTYVHVGWLREMQACSLYVDAVGVVAGGHVREDDLVAFFESVEDFNGVYGNAA